MAVGQSWREICWRARYEWGKDQYRKTGVGIVCMYDHRTAINNEKQQTSVAAILFQSSRPSVVRDSNHNSLGLIFSAFELWTDSLDLNQMHPPPQVRQH